jgi:N-acetylneuraminic acid mutarotase
MPRPAHHAALASANGKVYVMGGFVPPKDTAIPVGGAWEPIDNAWEYDPAADSWKPLPPLPGKRGSAIAAEVGGKIYVIGGATTAEGSKDPFFTFFGPARVLSTNDVYDPATNKWESRAPMSVPRNHAFSGVVDGKIYVIGGRTGHAFILSAATRTSWRSTTRSRTPGVLRRSGCPPLEAEGPPARTAAGSTWPEGKSPPKRSSARFEPSRRTTR